MVRALASVTASCWVDIPPALVAPQPTCQPEAGAGTAWPGLLALSNMLSAGQTSSQMLVTHPKLLAVVCRALSEQVLLLDAIGSPSNGIMQLASGLTCRWLGPTPVQRCPPQTCKCCEATSQATTTQGSSQLAFRCSLSVYLYSTIVHVALCDAWNSQNAQSGPGCPVPHARCLIMPQPSERECALYGVCWHCSHAYLTDAATSSGLVARSDCITCSSNSPSHVSTRCRLHNAAFAAPRLSVSTMPTPFNMYATLPITHSMYQH